MENVIAETKPLVLLDYCKGLEQHFNKRSFTIVTASFQANTLTDGYVRWFESVLPQWQKLLDEESGGGVRKISIFPDKKYAHLGKIEVEMCFAGELMLCGFHPEVGKDILNQIKKRVALDLLSIFPFPFDTKNPLYHAGVDDLFTFSAGHSAKAGKTEHIPLAEIFQKLQIYEPNGCEFISFVRNCELYKNDPLVEFVNDGGVLTVRWKYHATTRDRFDLWKAIENIKKESGIDFLRGPEFRYF